MKFDAYEMSKNSSEKFSLLDIIFIGNDLNIIFIGDDKKFYKFEDNKLFSTLKYDDEWEMCTYNFNYLNNQIYYELSDNYDLIQCLIDGILEDENIEVKIYSSLIFDLSVKYTKNSITHVMTLTYVYILNTSYYKFKIRYPEISKIYNDLVDIAMVMTGNLSYDNNY